MKRINRIARWCIVCVVLACSLNVTGQALQGSYSSKFFRYPEGMAFSEKPSDTWNEVAWKGDRVQTQLLVWSTAPLHNLTYTVSPLSDGANLIPAEQLTLRQLHYVKGDPQARTCYGYFTHASSVNLAEAVSNTRSPDVAPGDPLKLWLTLDVPATTPAGSYRGTITVRSDDATLEFKINLTVVDKTLPPPAEWTFHLDVWQHPGQVLRQYNAANTTPIEVWSPEHFALFMPAYKLLASAGQDVITAHIKDGALGNPSMVRWILQRDGLWAYDFTAFDKYVSAMMNIGIDRQISAFSMVGWNEDVIPYWNEATGTMEALEAPIGSATYIAQWNDFLNHFKSHLDEKGWFEKTVLFMDEVSEEKMVDVIAVIKSNNPQWKIGLAHVKEISEVSRQLVYDLSGALSISEGHTNPLTTFYTSCVETIPNNYVTPDNSPAEMTWMPWYALHDGLDGYLRWAYDFWRSVDPFSLLEGGNTAGDFSMIFRSSNTAQMVPLTSIRLEMLREGIQDFEKIKILRQELAASTDPFDAQALAALNSKVDQFTNTSGTGAAQLVQEGQQLLKEIVTRTYGYCRAKGGAYKDYFIEAATSAGGRQQLNYQASGYPQGGYTYYTGTQVSTKANQSVWLDVTTSAASKCARLKVWIDWNSDTDFDDAGEVVFTGGNFESCNNAVHYSIQVFVDPRYATPGTRRMRMRLNDAWKPLPTACGEEDYTATADFVFVVDDEYCAATSGYNQVYYISKLKTNSCLGNVDYSATLVPTAGYAHYSGTHLTLAEKGSVEVTLQTSEAARCARIAAWVDWNRDGKFTANEAVFSAGKFQSCLNPTAYTFMLTPPLSRVHGGYTRMRVQLRDAWQDVPDPCVVDAVAGTTDFDINITVNPSEACAPMMLSPTPGAQLGAGTATFQWTSNNTRATRYELMIYSNINEVVVHFVGFTTGTTLEATGLPTDGRPLQVTLSYLTGSTWSMLQYAYTAHDVYCPVRGGTNQTYFVLGLTTQDGVENISFSTVDIPAGGYQHPQENYLTVVRGSTFTMDLQNSLASFCARTWIWIDWNQDRVFAINEVVFNGGEYESCKAPDHFTFPVNVPGDALPGYTRMRIRVQDAFTDSLYPCEVNTSSGVSDFDIRISDVLASQNDDPYNTLAAYPNPATHTVMVRLGPAQAIDADVIVTDVLGRTTYHLQHVHTATINLDMEGYAPGLYTIAVVDNTTPHTTRYLKIIKKE